MVHQGDQVFSAASFRWPGGAVFTAQSHAGCCGPAVPTSAGQPDNAWNFSDRHQQPLPERESATSNPTASDYDQAAQRTAIPGVHHLLSRAHECGDREGVSCIAGQTGVRRNRAELPREPRRGPGEPEDYVSVHRHARTGSDRRATAHLHVRRSHAPHHERSLQHATWSGIYPPQGR